MAALPDVDWTHKTQRARFFSWRVRASGWMWALSGDPDLARDYEVVVATSLTGVVALKAMCPALRDVPLWLYFHENQFAHPLEARQEAAHRMGWRFQSLQNALCADAVSFNTVFNRDTFLEGAAAMLRRFPERLPGDPVGQIRRRSDVLPVPLTETFAAYRNTPKEAGLIVWNHRWEWDKQPERFLEALVRLRREGVAFRVAMLGSGGGRDGALAGYREALGDRVAAWGEADPANYREWVGRAAVGVSCALHDFQGLSVLELAQAGARVVVPRRVAYPECVPGAVFYEGSPSDAEAEIDALAGALREVLARAPSGPANGGATPPTWHELAPDYRRRLEALAAGP